MLFGIKGMLSRDEMRKIKAGSGCTAVGADCVAQAQNCPSGCVCTGSDTVINGQLVPTGQWTCQNATW